MVSAFLVIEVHQLKGIADTINNAERVHNPAKVSVDIPHMEH